MAKLIHDDSVLMRLVRVTRRADSFTQLMTMLDELRVEDGDTKYLKTPPGINTAFNLVFALILAPSRILLRRRRTRIVSPPGHAATKILSYVFTKKTFENVFSQAIIDMREEHAEALQNNAKWKSRWIATRDCTGLILTVSVYLVDYVAKKFSGIWKLIP